MFRKHFTVVLFDYRFVIQCNRFTFVLVDYFAPIRSVLTHPVNHYFVPSDNDTGMFNLERIFCESCLHPAVINRERFV